MELGHIRMLESVSSTNSFIGVELETLEHQIQCLSRCLREGFTQGDLASGRDGFEHGPCEWRFHGLDVFRRRLSGRFQNFFQLKTDFWEQRGMPAVLVLVMAVINAWLQFRRRVPLKKEKIGRNQGPCCIPISYRLEIKNNTRKSGLVYDTCLHTRKNRERTNTLKRLGFRRTGLFVSFRTTPCRL